MTGPDAPSRQAGRDRLGATMTGSPAPLARIRTALGLGRSVAIYLGRPWRQRGLAAFYRGILQPGDLAFDIGAHVGHRARAMRAAGARVVALEPQAAFARFLRASLPRDITLIEAAAGPAPAMAALAVSRLHPTVSSLDPGFAARAGALPGFGHVRWDTTQQVQVTTLDALIAAHGMPHFVKIDVEGFEAEVLAGLSQPVPVIAFEYLPGLPAVSAACIDRLEALGRYRFNPVEGEAQRFLWPDWRDAAAMRAWLAARAATALSGDVYARHDPA